jgi:hypothetical protein
MHRALPRNSASSGPLMDVLNVPDDPKRLPHGLTLSLLTSPWPTSTAHLQPLPASVQTYPHFFGTISMAKSLHMWDIHLSYGPSTCSQAFIPASYARKRDSLALLWSQYAEHAATSTVTWAVLHPKATLPRIFFNATVSRILPPVP